MGHAQIFWASRELLLSKKIGCVIMERHCIYNKSLVCNGVNRIMYLLTRNPDAASRKPTYCILALFIRNIVFITMAEIHLYRISMKHVTRQPLLQLLLMTSSNGNIFLVTGHLCGEVTGEFPAQRPVTRSFDVFSDLCLNERLNEQSLGWWFE